MKTFFERQLEVYRSNLHKVTDLYPRFAAKDLFQDLIARKLKLSRGQTELLCYHIIATVASNLPEDRWTVDALLSNEDALAVHTGLRLMTRLFQSSGEPITDEEAMMQANSLVQQYWHTWLYDASGRKVYEVSPALAEYLKYTEFRNVTTDALKLPFNHVYLKVPSNADLIVEGGEKVTRQGVEALSITEQAAIDGSGRHWNIMVVGKEDTYSSGLNDIFTFDVFLEPGQPIEEALERKSQEISNSMTSYIEALYESDSKVSFAPFWKKFFTWAMNVMMYTTWPEADIEYGIENAEELKDLKKRVNRAHGEKREALKKQLRHTTVRARIYLGRKMRRLPIPKQTGTDEEYRKLMVRCRVSGHWKTQAYGKGFSERRNIWIKPYWKGLENEIVSNPERILVAPGEHAR